MRFLVPVVALSLIAIQAHAQTPAAPSTAAPAPATAAPMTPPAAATTAPAETAPTTMHHAHEHMTLQERFDKANTTHDGHLTLEQAKAGMPMVAKHFEAIDKDKKGYVTVQDIHSYAAERRAAHHAAHHATSSPS